MSDIESTLNLIEKLEEATPVEQTNSTENINLSSSYISQIAGQDDKSSAFLTGNTIDSQINNISEISSSTRQNAEDLGLDLGMYDPEAKQKALKAQALAEAQAQKLANDKLIAEKKAKEAEIRAIERNKRREELKKFLQGQSDKDKRLGYSRGVFSGFLLSIVLFIISIIFFKSELIRFISIDFNNIADKASLFVSTNIDKDGKLSKYITNIFGEDFILDTTTPLTENTINNPENLNNNENQITETSFENNNLLLEDSSGSNIDNNSEIEQTIVKEYVTPETEENLSTLKFNVIYTNDTSLANRVISANCDNLSCGDYTKATSKDDIILCSGFRQNETLNDEDPRIGRSGTCRYKDTSELAILSIE